MTPAERIAQAHQRSVALYLQRQELEGERQQVLLKIQRVEQELVKLDGAIAAFELVQADGE